MMQFNLMKLFNKSAIPDKKLPIGKNEILSPQRSNVNYNYEPVQKHKTVIKKTNYSTGEMSNYIPSENGGI